MDSLSIYIHIPFCEQKCPYCDFYSINDKTEYERYTEHLISMIKMYSEKYRREITTIYFGGGTPSVIGAQRLSKILNAVKDSFVVCDDAEITVEVNPCSSSTLDFDLLRKSGFNRVSIGLQSSDKDELKLLGRRHNSADAKNTVERARKAGFDNISLDLMICVPTQTKSSLTKSIEFCKDCSVEHISAYILKFEENTPFYKMKDKFELFDDEMQARMYLHTINELEKNGYMQYEISNFCKKGFEGRHNLRYWRDQEYLGLGPSAHSFVENKRFYFSRSLDDFYNNITVDDGSGGDLEEYIMLSLRLKEGLSFIKLTEKYNYSPSKNFVYRANKLKEEKLVDFDGDVISLTKEGFLVSNTIIGYLIDAL